MKTGSGMMLVLPGGAVMDFVFCPWEDVPGSDNGFWMGKYPVTQGQWCSVMGVDLGGSHAFNEPVTFVTCDQCREFVKKINSSLCEGLVSLPTPREWTRACRGAGGIHADRFEDFAWYGNNSGGHIHAVGGKQPNGWGLCDMLGNVWELCCETHCEDAGTVIGERTDWSKHGGSYMDSREWCTATRHVVDSCTSCKNVGFRLVCSSDIYSKYLEGRGRQGDFSALLQLAETAEATMRENPHHPDFYKMYDEVCGWYRKAQEVVDVRIQTALQKLKNEWFEKASLEKKAWQGDSDAQFELGEMAESRLGKAVVAKDLACYYNEALYWYMQAANAGNPMGKTACDNLKQRGRGPSEMAVLAVLKDIILDELHFEESQVEEFQITMDTRFEDDLRFFDYESLVYLLVEVEERFGVEIDDQIDTNSTVGDLVRLLVSQTTQQVARYRNMLPRDRICMNARVV